MFSDIPLVVPVLGEKEKKLESLLPSVDTNDIISTPKDEGGNNDTGKTSLFYA